MVQTEVPLSPRSARSRSCAPAVLLLILPFDVAVPTCQPKAVSHVRR